MKGRLNLWLLLAAGLCALSLWVGWRSGGEGGTAAPGPAGGRAPEAAPEDAAPIHLLVLNGTDEQGLARDFSLLLGPTGCVVERVANAPEGDWSACVLVNRRLPEGRAKDLAARLGGVEVVREWDGRTTEDAVLVLGRDWARVRAALAGTSHSD